MFIVGFLVSPLRIFWMVKYDTPLFNASAMTSALDIAASAFVIFAKISIPYFYTGRGEYASIMSMQNLQS